MDEGTCQASLFLLLYYLMVNGKFYSRESSGKPVTHGLALTHRRFMDEEVGHFQYGSVGVCGLNLQSRYACLVRIHSARNRRTSASRAWTFSFFQTINGKNFGNEEGHNENFM